MRSGVRNFDENIKTALASSYSRADMKTEQARKPFQTTSEVFFGMKYHLSPQDAEAEPLAKKPCTSSDYNSRYTNVLPSSKVINDTKHLLAIQQERNAASAILDISDDDRVTTLHFDTASRKRINGEWSSVIMRTKDGKKFRMCPLSMAVETRDNITFMIVAALKRLSVASGADSEDLWEKVSALMTDSVAKNLHIE